MQRSQAFEDTLHLIVCTLGRPLMEDEYMETVQRHTKGEKGKRGIDTIVRFLGELVNAMAESNRDILGDVFEGGVSRGQAGQFLTPQPVCELMARTNLPTEPTDLDGRRTVGDPCCGSGRMLLAASEIQPNWHFVGQDIDLICVRMTAINLALRNRYGHVIWGETLKAESRLVYETGRVEVWGNAIRKVELRDAPPAVQHVATEELPPSSIATNEKQAQLRLFD